MIDMQTSHLQHRIMTITCCIGMRISRSQLHIHQRPQPDISQLPLLPRPISLEARTGRRIRRYQNLNQMPLMLIMPSFARLVENDSRLMTLTREATQSRSRRGSYHMDMLAMRILIRTATVSCRVVRLTGLTRMRSELRRFFLTLSWLTLATNNDALDITIRFVLHS